MKCQDLFSIFFYFSEKTSLNISCESSAFYFSEKTSLNVSFESSAKQMIHTKCQDLFSLNNKRKKKLSSAAVVIGTLRVKSSCRICSVRMSILYR